MKVYKARVIISSIVIPLLMLSCVVSKRKFEELEYAKRRSDAKLKLLSQENEKQKQKISGLNSKLDLTLSEYNEMKNSMSESNAMKTSEIDALNTDLMGLTSNATELEGQLRETQERYEQASMKVSQNLSQISLLQNRIDLLVSDSANLARELKDVRINLDWEKKRMESEKSDLTREIKLKEGELDVISKELEDYKGKASWLRKVNARNEEEIERLNNQLNLYKKELDKALQN